VSWSSRPFCFFTFFGFVLLDHAENGRCYIRWLSDLNRDGKLDMEEFCIAMRLTYDILTSNLKAIPSELPLELVPKSQTSVTGGSISPPSSSTPTPTFHQIPFMNVPQTQYHQGQSAPSPRPSPLPSPQPSPQTSPKFAYQSPQLSAVCLFSLFILCCSVLFRC